MKTQVHIYYHDNSRSSALYDDVHQILMTGEHSISMGHNGSQVITIPYDEIREIRIRFKGSTNE